MTTSSEYKPNVELIAWFKSEAEPTLQALIGHIYHPSIQEVFNANFQQIIRNYNGLAADGVILDVPHSYYVPNQPPEVITPFAARNTNRIPQFAVFLPDLKRILQEVCGGNKRLFETTFVVGFGHELDHLALDQPLSDANPQQLLLNEIYAHARTCSTLLPKLIAMGLSLNSWDFQRHEAWVKSPDSESKAWRDFIADYHHLPRL